jgi:hypothetical protein
MPLSQKIGMSSRQWCSALPIRRLAQVERLRYHRGAIMDEDPKRPIGAAKKLMAGRHRNLKGNACGTQAVGRVRRGNAS